MIKNKYANKDHKAAFQLIEEYAFPPHPLQVDENKFYHWSSHVKLNDVLSLLYYEQKISLEKWDFLEYYFPYSFNIQIIDSNKWFNTDYIQMYYNNIREHVSCVEFDDIWTIGSTARYENEWDMNSEYYVEAAIMFRNQMDLFKLQMVL